MRGLSTSSGAQREVSGTLGVTLSETFTCGGSVYSVSERVVPTKGDKGYGVLERMSEQCKSVHGLGLGT